MNQKYGFYFEKAGLSRPHGATSSDEEHFRGTSIAESLVRELGQNSLDAVDPEGDGVVRIVFELAEMATSDIPDVETLKEHIKKSDEATRSIDAKNTRLKDAAAAIDSPSLMVLRVGDYGTKGLAGKEGKLHNDTPLVALTRGAGISAAKDGAGGSFGVGSSVGTMSSEILTVLWTSLAVGESETVFAGYSQLATHRDSAGVDRQADGFFIDREERDDFRYLRSPEPVGPFGQRSEKGTDVYVLGYRDASEDQNLTLIKEEFVKNFMVAIDRGKLIVEGVSPRNSWKLDQDSLSEYVDEIEEAKPFYRALKNSDPYTEEVGALGELKLYMEFDDRFPHKYHTITMRKPLMKITQYRHNSISAKYAAIMICEDSEGNDLLRSLEPPRHDKWEEKRASHGVKTIREVKNFIRRGLTSRISKEIGEEVEIKGLSRFLPAELASPHLTSQKKEGTPTQGDPTETESVPVVGRPSEEIPVTPSKPSAVSVRVRKKASTDGDQPVNKGKESGGSAIRDASGGNIPGTGREGDGTSRIEADSIKMRSWTDSETGDVILKLHSSVETQGDLTLCALGPNGTVEEGFVLPIKSVNLLRNGNITPLKTVKNTVKDVTLEGDRPMAELRIELSQKRRFRLGVI